MDLHQNARLTFRSREALAKKIMIEKVTVNAAAAAFTVSRKTVAKWLRRYRTLGLPGLRDRSSRPLHSPRRTSSELVAHVIALRRQLRPAYQIAQATGLSPASVSRILRRAQSNRWRHLHPAPPVVRYQHPAPGDLPPSARKRVEKLRYMHRNPVKRGLVESPEQWAWSSFRW